jgi:hypothetical protein
MNAQMAVVLKAWKLKLTADAPQLRLAGIARLVHYWNRRLLRARRLQLQA